MDYGKFNSLEGYVDFMISKNGYIYDVGNQCLLNPIFNSKGFIEVSLNDTNVRLDKLILSVFVGKMDADIKYKDGDKSNCSLKNISYKLNIIHDKDNTYINGIKFKQIPGFCSYMISEDGIIYSQYNNKLISKAFNHNDYVVATIIDDSGYRAPRRVHRLVYITYVGNIEEDKVLDHLDGKKYNNHVTNLEQVDHVVNIRRALDTGLDDRKRWDLDIIHNICILLEKNTTINDIIISLNLDVSYRDMTMLIHNLIHDKLYSYITKDYDIKNYNSAINKKDRLFTEDDVIYIWNALVTKNKTVLELSREFNCSTSAISKIRDFKTWKHVTCKLNRTVEVLRDESSTTIETNLV